MAYEFRLRFFTPTGIGIGEVTSFLSLACSVRVNQIDRLSVVLRGDMKILPELDYNCRVELDWRDKDLGMGWTPFFRGIIRQREVKYQPTRQVSFGVVGLNWFLATRVNAFYTNLSDRTRFTNRSAEFILKTLVMYNLSNQATTLNGRLVDGTGWPSTLVQIEPNEDRGNIIPSWYCAQDKLLDVFQKLAPLAGGDFSFAPVPGGLYEFQFHPGQLGVDRSADVIFSLENENMAEPIFKRDQIEEKTVVLVGGQGEDADRDFVSMTGPDYSVNNAIEIFTDATNVNKGDIAGLQAVGERKANEMKANDEFTFKVLQTKRSRLGMHYFLGDLVTAINPETSELLVQKVVGQDLSFDSDGNPQIEVVVRTP